MTDNEEYIIDIKSIASDGCGVGHIDGLTVFVPFTVPGDTVKVRIDYIKPRFARAKLVKVISPSKDRIKPDCDIYEVCGGCSMRHITYEAELCEKRGIVENAMRRIGGFTDFALSAVTGMENPERYRNKTVFQAENGEFGFYAPKSHRFTAVSDCLLGIEENSNIIRAVREYISESGTYMNAVKNLFIRKAFKSGEIMVVLNVRRDIKNRSILIKKLSALNVTSVILEKDSKYETIFGKSSIYDLLCGIRFEISPESFFQINPVQTERLYNKALEFADIKPDDTVMDIYCGIGTISLCASRHAKKVTGIEFVNRAVDNARKNAENNGIKNAEFYAGKAENIVPQLIKNGEKPDTVILDPPRSGSDKKTLGAIIRANPKRIVYVSCNPATLARDTRFLAENGYEITAAEAFDMFPRTNHAETVVKMEKI